MRGRFPKTGRFLAIVLFALLVPGLVLASPAPSTAPTTAFQFQVPEGWIDLSRDASEANLSSVVPSVRELAVKARANPASLFYVAPPGVDSAASAMLRLESESEPIDEDALARLRRELDRLGVLRTEEAHVEVVNGLNWGRFAGTTGPSGETRFVAYLIPGNPRSVVFLFSAPKERYAELVPAFDRAARSTRGAQNPPKKAHLPDFGLFAIGALGVGMLGWLHLRRRRPRATQPAPGRARSRD